MEITWLGYSCFRIKGKQTTIITDPYPPDFGYAPARMSAQIVTMSHRHPGHSYSAGVDGSPRVLAGPGEYEVGGVLVLGIPTFHDAEGGTLRGKNTVYLVQMEDMSLVHLGDLGHTLTAAQRAELGTVDVLMLPVGGGSALGASTAAQVMRQIEPKVVLPMHFKTPEISKELDPADKFLREIGISELAPQPRLSVTRTNIGEGTRTILLDYPRR